MQMFKNLLCKFGWHGVYRSQWIEQMQRKAYLYFYIADEDGNALSLSKNKIDIQESSLLAFGSRLDVGDWQLHLESKVTVTNGVVVKFSLFTNY